jgi:hypothetical protein
VHDVIVLLFLDIDNLDKKGRTRFKHSNIDQREVSFRFDTSESMRNV